MDAIEYLAKVEAVYKGDAIPILDAFSTAKKDTPVSEQAWLRAVWAMTMATAALGDQGVIVLDQLSREQMLLVLDEAQRVLRERD